MGGEPPIEVKILPPLPDTSGSDDSSGAIESYNSTWEVNSLSTETTEATETIRKRLLSDLNLIVMHDTDDSSSSVPSDDDESNDYSEQDHCQLGCGAEPVVHPPVPELPNSDSLIRPVSNSGSHQFRNLQTQLELMKIQVAIIQLLA